MPTAMRTVTVEEHAAVPELWEAFELWMPPAMKDRLNDMGEERLADMDANGIDVQVLSMQSPGESADPDKGLRAVRAFNVAAAETVRAHPTRFAALAALPFHDPVAAAAELEHAVTQLGAKGALVGTRLATGFMSEQVNWPLWEAAEGLGVPVYMHPSFPPKPVYDAYYADLGPQLGLVLATGMWGWHVDTGMHTIRLIMRGVFDRFPNLQVVIGHMGEAIPIMMGRISQSDDNGIAAILDGVELPYERPIREYFKTNIHLTTSGFFDYESLHCAISVVGVDRILFAVDYPFSQNAAGREFLDAVPISEADRAAIAHENADRLFALSTEV